MFDPTESDTDLSKFPREDWSETRDGECKEELPTNATQERGIGIAMRDVFDSDHAGDTVTKRSRNGFDILLNNATIYWFYKKQTSIETL